MEQKTFKQCVVLVGLVTAGYVGAQIATDEYQMWRAKQEMQAVVSALAPTTSSERQPTTEDAVRLMKEIYGPDWNGMSSDGMLKGADEAVREAETAIQDALDAVQASGSSK